MRGLVAVMFYNKNQKLMAVVGDYEVEAVVDIRVNL